jgi:hypothetical protein
MTRSGTNPLILPTYGPSLRGLQTQIYVLAVFVVVFGTVALYAFSLPDLEAKSILSSSSKGVHEDPEGRTQPRLSVQPETIMKRDQYSDKQGLMMRVINVLGIGGYTRDSEGVLNTDQRGAGGHGTFEENLRVTNIPGRG